jgi:hypothetical protein
MDEISESRSQDERGRTDDEEVEKRAKKKKRKLGDSLAPEDAKLGSYPRSCGPECALMDTFPFREGLFSIP